MSVHLVLCMKSQLKLLADTMVFAALALGNAIRHSSHIAVFAVHTLEDTNLEAIREAVGLEAKLQTLVGERVSEGVDWAILERLAPLLHLWVAKQMSMVRSWYERIVMTETWQPVSQPRGCSR